MSAPFLRDSSTSRAPDDSLPYHWLELGHLLLTHAADDFEEPDAVRRLIRDLREVRLSKLRKGFKELNPTAAFNINGVGGMEVAEVRGFIGGVVDGLRYVSCSSIRFMVFWWNTNTKCFVGRSIVLEKTRGESAMRKKTAMVEGTTKMKMTTCSYEISSIYYLQSSRIGRLQLYSTHSRRLPPFTSGTETQCPCHGRAFFPIQTKSKFRLLAE